MQNKRFTQLFSVVFSLIFIHSSVAVTTPTPAQREALERKRQTEQFIDKQEQKQNYNLSRPDDIQRDLIIGQDRAREIIRILQDQELQKAFADINERGRNFLNNNEGAKAPLGVLAGAASLWIGRTFRLIREQQFELSSRFEGRSQSGEFNLNSPLLNGSVLFNRNDGMGLRLNRELGLLDTRTEFSYFSRDQRLSTGITHRLSPNIDLSFGVSQSAIVPQTDSRAGIHYQLSF